jgi:putative transposase
MADAHDITVVDEAAWNEAVVRATVLRRLAGQARLNRADVLGACQELGIRRARLYQLLRAYTTRPVTSSLVNRPKGSRLGSRRLSAAVEALIDAAIQTFYRTQQKPSVNALHKEVRRLCWQKGVRAPSWHAVQARVKTIDPKALIADREGANAARDRFRPVPGQYRADHAFEVVQIDHTMVDLIVVDSAHRMALQRPWLTLAIDVASRMVAGFYLSLEAPSAVSVALAIQHLALPKQAWLSARDVKADWPTAGFPDAIHVDNGKDFLSHALRRGAEEYGISLVHRPVATPHYGGHIERLIGTMMGAVHLLPGTTFSDIEARGGYDSGGRAAMTLDELERWIALEITRYHAERHAGIGLPPRAAWDEAIAKRPYPLRHPHDPAAFLIDFLPSVERRAQRDGVHLFGLRYWDDVLSLWAGRLDRPLRVAYDPRDLSTVFVHGPDGSHWPIRFADLRRPPITLWEHRRAQAALRDRGLTLVDEQLIFETIEQQRALIADAARRTKSARRSGERADRALAGASARLVIPAAPAPDEDKPINFNDYPIFPVEEWS